MKAETEHSTEKKTDLKKLAELIQGIRVAMMQTCRGGPPTQASNWHVRPMYTQKIDPETFAGELYFFSDLASAKIDELAENDSIMLTYSEPDKDRYVVVYGRAAGDRDPKKAGELWNIHAKGWWPGGPQSSNLAVIRVQVTSAEYWDGPNKLTYAAKLLFAVARGERVAMYGDHGKIE